MLKIKRFFNFSSKPLPEIEPGFYTSHQLTHEEMPYRLHLRVEKNQTGVLTLNASTVLRLNKTAMEMAYFLIQGQNPDQIARTISNRYKASKKQIKADIDLFYGTLMGLAVGADLPPTATLGLGSDDEETDIIAPYRLDCSLNSNITGKTLSVSEWKIVLEKAYNAGIPHILFLDVANEMKAELIDLLNHAETLGLVSGLVTTPEFLMEHGFISRLINCGLDHLVIDANPLNPDHLNIITTVLDQDLFTCLRMDHLPENNYEDVFEILFAHGLNAFAYKVKPMEMSKERFIFEERLTMHNIPILDDFPPSNLDLSSINKQIEETKITFKYIQLLADGKLVLPGSDFLIGNLLEEPWDTLWAKCHHYNHG